MSNHFDHQALAADVEKHTDNKTVIAKRAGVSVKTLNNILAGKGGERADPSRRKIAKAIGKEYEDYCDGPPQPRILTQPTKDYRDLIIYGFRSRDFMAKAEEFAELEPDDLLEEVFHFFETNYIVQINNLAVALNTRKEMLAELLKGKSLSCLIAHLECSKMIHLEARFGMEFGALLGFIKARYNPQPEYQKTYQKLRKRQQAALDRFRGYLDDLAEAIRCQEWDRIVVLVRQCLEADCAYHMAIDIVGNRLSEFVQLGVDPFYHEGAIAALRLLIAAEKGEHAMKGIKQAQMILEDFYKDLKDLSEALDKVSSPTDQKHIDDVHTILYRHHSHTESLLDLNIYSADMLAAQGEQTYSI